MACDLFTRTNARRLLNCKIIWFFGDSNMRCLYKDLVWLLEYGSMTSLTSLQTRNEDTHAGDVKTSEGGLHPGRNYEEVREYRNGVYIKFVFVTRICADNFVYCLKSFTRAPDLIIIGSCVWDITRWGPDGVKTYKTGLMNALGLLKEHLPKSTRVIFTTALPISSDCRGGFLRSEIECLRYTLPWHFVEANNFMTEYVKLHHHDVLDLYHHMRYLLEEWSHDGIHWTSNAYRFMTNLLLTHISLSEERLLPNVFELDEFLLRDSEEVELQITIRDEIKCDEKNRIVENKFKRSRKRYDPRVMHKNGQNRITVRNGGNTFHFATVTAANNFFMDNSFPQLCINFW